jgi:hypothetical protein
MLTVPPECPTGWKSGLDDISNCNRTARGRLLASATKAHGEAPVETTGMQKTDKMRPLIDAAGLDQPPDILPQPALLRNLLRGAFEERVDQSLIGLGLLGGEAPKLGEETRV